MIPVMVGPDTEASRLEDITSQDSESESDEHVRACPLDSIYIAAVEGIRQARHAGSHIDYGHTTQEPGDIDRAERILLWSDASLVYAIVKRFDQSVPVSEP